MLRISQIVPMLAYENGAAALDWPATAASTGPPTSRATARCSRSDTAEECGREDLNLQGLSPNGT
jgi:hypothetical protein